MSSKVKTETQSTERTSQALIEDDDSITVLSIAISFKNRAFSRYFTRAQLENTLVNAAPLMVFTLTNEAFEALSKGTVENLLNPEK